MASHKTNQNFCPELRKILDGVPCPIAILDHDLRLMEMNRHLEALIGYSVSEVRGFTYDQVLRTNIGRNHPLFRRALSNEEQGSEDGDIIGFNRKKIPMRFTVTPLQAETDQKKGIVLAIEDISALRRLNLDIFTAPAMGLICHSPKMQEIMELLPVLAHTDSSVLITGETGTGKDLLAEAIHRSSKRSKYPFIKVNCGALPESLLESELFGHTRGAFTGAHNDKQGMFQLANGGTIFLTEIGDLPLPLQVKLLTVLDDREFFPLGSQKKVKVDVRIIAGTHRDLKALVEKGSFREDLFFRLNVLRIHIPPLREREGDLPLLIDHFIQLFSTNLNKRVRKLSPEAEQLLFSYCYPGNVRELRNIIEYGVNLCQGEIIGLNDLPSYLREMSSKKVTPAVAPPVTEKGIIPAEQEKDQESWKDWTDISGNWESIEKKRILAALSRHGGNRGEAAKSLGWGRVTLWRKMKKYQI